MTGLVDPVDRLIRAWIAWEAAPRAEWTAHEKEDAIRAASLGGIAAHHHVVACRHAGMTIPSAVQSAVNDLAPPEGRRMTHPRGSAP